MKQTMGLYRGRAPMMAACLALWGLACDSGAHGADIDADAEIPGDEYVADTADDHAADAVDADDVFSGSTIRGRALFNNTDEHAGVLVELFRESVVTARIAQTLTAADGAWTFSRLEPGRYSLRASLSGLTVEGEQIVTNLFVGYAETITVPDFLFTATGRISGRAAFVGFLDEWYPDDSGISIYLPGREKLVLTDREGNFLLDSVPPGKYTVCAGHSAGVGECAEGVEVSLLTLTVMDPLSIRKSADADESASIVQGTVTMAGAKDSSGITVDVLTGSKVLATTTTDAAGGYRFDRINSGVFSFRFSAPEGSGYERDARFNLFEIFAGVDELIPPQILARGSIITETSPISSSPASLLRTAVFTPDSSRLLYLRGDGILMVADLAAPTAEHLILARDVEDFVVAPDSSFVLYRPAGDTAMLFTAPIDGGPKTLISSQSHGHMIVTPDSAHVIHTRKTDSNNSDFDVLVADPGTGVSQYLCPHSPPTELFVAPDSGYLVCLDHRNTVRIVRIANGTLIYRHDSVHGYAPDPAAHTIVTCEEDSGIMTRVDATSGTATPLQGKAGWCDLHVTPSAVFYLDDRIRLMSSPLDGGEPREVAAANMIPLDMSPDFTKIVGYRRHQADAIDAYDLYAVDVGIGSPTLLATGVTKSNWEHNRAPNVDTGLPQDYGYMMGRDSDSIYVVTDYNDDEQPERVLHRISLDGSNRVELMTLSSTVQTWDNGLLWDVNEETGFAVGTAPDGSVAVRALDDVTPTLLESSTGAKLAAPDRSGFLFLRGSPPILTWYRPEDGTSLHLDGGEMADEALGNGTLWYRFSPDSKHVVFASIFGRAMNGYLPGAVQRLHVADIR